MGERERERWDGMGSEREMEKHTHMYAPPHTFFPATHSHSSHTYTHFLTLPIMPCRIAQREVLVMRTCKHENIVQVLSADLKGKKLHLSMELAAAGAVSDLLKKQGPLPEPVAAIVLKGTLQVCTVKPKSALVACTLCAQCFQQCSGGSHCHVAFT